MSDIITFFLKKVNFFLKGDTRGRREFLREENLNQQQPQIEFPCILFFCGTSIDRVLNRESELREER